MKMFFLKIIIWCGKNKSNNNNCPSVSKRTNSSKIELTSYLTNCLTDVRIELRITLWLSVRANSVQLHLPATCSFCINMYSIIMVILCSSVKGNLYIKVNLWILKMFSRNYSLDLCSWVDIFTGTYRVLNVCKKNYFFIGWKVLLYSVEKSFDNSKFFLRLATPFLINYA